MRSVVACSGHSLTGLHGMGDSVAPASISQPSCIIAAAAAHWLGAQLCTGAVRCLSLPGLTILAARLLAFVRLVSEQWTRSVRVAWRWQDVVSSSMNRFSFLSDVTCPVVSTRPSLWSKRRSCLFLVPLFDICCMWRRCRLQSRWLFEGKFYFDLYSVFFTSYAYFFPGSNLMMVFSRVMLFHGRVIQPCVTLVVVCLSAVAKMTRSVR